MSNDFDDKKTDANEPDKIIPEWLKSIGDTSGIYEGSTAAELCLNLKMAGDDKSIKKSLQHILSISTIHKIAIECNSDGHTVGSWIIDILKQKSTLDSIMIVGYINSGCKYLGEGLKVASNIKSLRFYRSEMMLDEFKWICDGLRLNRSLGLETLDLHGNMFGSPGAELLGDLLKSNTTITDLDLAECFMHEDNPKFFDALKTNTTLRELNLFHNYINADQLGQALKQNQTLTCLHIGLCAIRDKIGSIADALIDHQSLRAVYMSYNKIEDLRLAKLVECVRENYSLTTLQVTDSNSTDRYNPLLLEELNELLNRNRTMQNENYLKVHIIMRNVVRSYKINRILPAEIWSAIFGHITFAGITVKFSKIFDSLYQESIKQ